MSDTITFTVEALSDTDALSQAERKFRSLNTNLIYQIASMTVHKKEYALWEGQTGRWRGEWDVEIVFTKYE